jgi:hypothetical protein
MNGLKNKIFFLSLIIVSNALFYLIVIDNNPSDHSYSDHDKVKIKLKALLYTPFELYLPVQIYLKNHSKPIEAILIDEIKEKHFEDQSEFKQVVVAIKKQGVTLNPNQTVEIYPIGINRPQTQQGVNYEISY